MDDEKEIEIVLDDPKTEPEAKKDDTVVVVDDQEQPAQQAETQSQESTGETLEKMRKKLEQANKKAQKFEREKAEAETRAQYAMQEAGENRKHVMMAALNQVKSDAELLQAQFAEAMHLNNFELAGKIQSQIAANEVRKVQFESELDNLKRQDIAPQVYNKLDQIIRDVSPTSAKWLRENREHLEDENAIDDMFDFHRMAVRKGIKPDTDEYFEFIEKGLGISKDEPEEKPSKRKTEEDADDEPMSVAAKPKTKSAPPPPAPVERYGSRPNVVRLTRAEAETAQMLGMTEKEYAMHKVALQKEGKLPH